MNEENISISEPQARHHKTRCDYCGDSPVNHFSTFLNETFSNAINYFFLNSGFLWIYDFIESLAERFASFFVFFFRILGIASFKNDFKKTKTLRSALIWREAKKRGIIMEQLFLFGMSTEWYRAKIKNKWHYFESIPIAPRFSRGGHMWLDHKHILKKRLVDFKIPVPRSRVVLSASGARAALSEIGSSVVVKPCTGSRGRHTSVFVNSEEDILESFRRARKLNYFVVVEEHLLGSVCRATVVNGRLRGFLKADSPEVFGDGIKTVKELIEEKNQRRHPRVAEVIIRPELLEFIKRQGYDLSSVIPEGKRLQLVFRTGRFFGGKTREMLSEVHPVLASELERAGRLVDAPVVGFDLIIPDPSKDPREQKWGIIEGNSLPFIDLHDYALEGASANVAKHIWDLWDGS